MTSVDKTPSVDTVDEIAVLIVEDEQLAREASERYLDHCGYRVATAASALQALDQAADMAPDVLVCDWRLGGDLDGVYIARQLQQRFGTRIVFVTAYPLDQLREVTGDLEVARYLRKPFSLTILAETIAGAI
jgi:CheY-like chemotaxis protein